MTTLLALALIIAQNTAVWPDSGAVVSSAPAPATRMTNTVLVHHAPTVKIDCDAAEVRIVSWLSDKVRVSSQGSAGTLTRLDSSNTVIFHHKENSRSLSQDMMPAVHTIFVPSNAVVEVFLANGNITVDGPVSKMSIAVDRGNITLKDAAGVAEAATTVGTLTRTTNGEPSSVQF